MDEKTLSEIRERNEKRKDADCEGLCACCWSESESDIDALLTEVERLRAYIDRYRAVTTTVDIRSTPNWR